MVEDHRGFCPHCGHCDYPALSDDRDVCVSDSGEDGLVTTIGLLGGGESLLEHDFAIANMPLVGINESWRVWQTDVTVFVEPDPREGQPEPKRAYFPLPHMHRSDEGVLEQLRSYWPNAQLCPIPWKRVLWEDTEFHGFNLGNGTNAFSSGMLALELVTWWGFREIHLFGFDLDTSAHYENHPVIKQPMLDEWKRQLPEAILQMESAGIRVVRR